MSELLAGIDFVKERSPTKRQTVAVCLNSVRNVSWLRSGAPTFPFSCVSLFSRWKISFSSTPTHSALTKFSGFVIQKEGNKKKEGMKVFFCCWRSRVLLGNSQLSHVGAARPVCPSDGFLTSDVITHSLLFFLHLSSPQTWRHETVLCSASASEHQCRNTRHRGKEAKLLSKFHPLCRSKRKFPPFLWRLLSLLVIICVIDISVRGFRQFGLRWSSSLTNPVFLKANEQKQTETSTGNIMRWCFTAFPVRWSQPSIFNLHTV